MSFNSKYYYNIDKHLKKLQIKETDTGSAVSTETRCEGVKRITAKETMYSCIGILNVYHAWHVYISFLMYVEEKEL